MKALSIKQPWSWLIVNGYKNIENRKWKTNFRGEFYIHASKAFDLNGYNFVKEHFPDIFKLIPSIDKFETGGIVGSSYLKNCISSSDSPWFFGPFGFELEKSKVMKFKPMKGQLGFFDVNLNFESYYFEEEILPKSSGWFKYADPESMLRLIKKELSNPLPIDKWKLKSEPLEYLDLSMVKKMKGYSDEKRTWEWKGNLGYFGHYPYEDWFKLLKDIHDHGLQYPITLKKINNEYKIYEGNHRIAALEQLGYQKIPVEYL
jgi:hypothetical protein